MNEFKIMGTLTIDAETTTSKKGTQILKFVVAVESGYGNYKRTDFIWIKALGKTAEFAWGTPKGTIVIVMGEINTSENAAGYQSIEFIARSIYPVNSATLKEESTIY